MYQSIMQTILNYIIIYEMDFVFNNTIIQVSLYVENKLKSTPSLLFVLDQVICSKSYILVPEGNFVKRL